ncbi:hypothetical protein [Streptomyces echinatus]|uniref:hypothetical protein n=1 Tax=Streptomyces echinatus TaxID=67293 RepID=UPI00378ECDE3
MSGVAVGAEEHLGPVEAEGWVYGCDHDDPHPGPLPARTYASLVGGPLDGLLLDVTGWTADEVDGGVAQSTELSRCPAAAHCYDPSADEPRTPGPGVACRFHYCGDTPWLPARWRQFMCRCCGG